MNATIRGISSMATRALLAELVAAYEARTGQKVEVEAVGGVDAARRVQSGEAFDVVFLATDAIEKLAAAGPVVAGSRVDLVRSGVYAAVKSGAEKVDLSNAEAVKRAVLAAPTLGYSTGPSGVALMKLFERWGIAEQLKPKIVQAPPGVPVGSLVARGEVALGFQQLSELIHLDGIDIAGPLPPDIQITTIFCGAVCAASGQADAVGRLLAFMASPEADDAKRRQGMEPA
ncbi:extracellular solute-binding protein [Ramlibacter sp.]|uniref:substrate-binding domain-containing protein n=1 Tax=Ramlibacter sp. TaxID=1917967 RepID=UPI003D1149A9